jgi:hypothetical protein
MPADRYFNMKSLATSSALRGNFKVCKGVMVDNITQQLPKQTLTVFNNTYVNLRPTNIKTLSSGPMELINSKV